MPMYKGIEGWGIYAEIPHRFPTGSPPLTMGNVKNAILGNRRRGKTWIFRKNFVPLQLDNKDPNYNSNY